jgi:hypothetical protein
MIVPEPSACSLDLTQDADGFRQSRQVVAAPLATFVPLQSQKATVTLTAATAFTNAFDNDVLGSIYADKIRTASLTFDGRLQEFFRGTSYRW